VSDDALNIDLTELKVREIEEIEEKLGVSINEAFQGKSLGKAMRAIGCSSCSWRSPIRTLRQRAADPARKALPGLPGLHDGFVAGSAGS
jgi:hypothetical protein